jgi:acyl-CoA thioester hydrolase
MIADWQCRSLWHLLGSSTFADKFGLKPVSSHMLPDYEIDVRVRYYETDAQGFVHHANYFQYFELARVEQLLALGYDYAQLERDGILLVVNKIACKFHRPSKFGDTLRIAIRTVRARGARIDHEYRVYRGNELLAEGESTLACIDREGRVQRLPEFLMEPAKAS